MHPAALGGQILGRTTLGIAHAIGQKWVYDPHYGLPVAKRFYQNRPPTILDVPVDMQWEALDIPDPETPVGARASANRLWRRLRCNPQCPGRCGGRRSFPARARQCRHDPGIVGSGTSDAAPLMAHI